MSCADCRKSHRLLAYEAETARLKALTEFLGAFTPALGERAEPGTEEIGDGVSPAILRAQEEAIVEGFGAVTLIAQSLPPEPDDDLEDETEVDDEAVS